MDMVGAQGVGSHTRVVTKIRVRANALTALANVRPDHGTVPSIQVLETWQDEVVFKTGRRSRARVQDRSPSRWGGTLACPRVPGVSRARSSVNLLGREAIGIHRVKEAMMSIGHQVVLAGKPLQWFTFKDALRAFDIIKDFSVEHKVSTVGPPFGFRFLGERLDRSVGFQFQQPKS